MADKRELDTSFALYMCRLQPCCLLCCVLIASTMTCLFHDVRETKRLPREVKCGKLPYKEVYTALPAVDKIIHTQNRKIKI